MSLYLGGKYLKPGSSINCTYTLVEARWNICAQGHSDSVQEMLQVKEGTFSGSVFLVCSVFYDDIESCLAEANFTLKIR